MKYFILTLLWIFNITLAQIPPSSSDLNSYQGLLAAVAHNNPEQVQQLLNEGADLEQRDTHERTPLLVAAHLSFDDVASILLEAGADPNSLDKQHYDLITIAAVNNDVEIIKVGLRHGANPSNITSPYDGTALIAAAHLGHVETVQTLIDAGAPLDHVNNLGWTALIEAIVLGDGGERHTAVVKALVEAGADVNLADSGGKTPLRLAMDRSYQSMSDILQQAGGLE
jgi:ankyrin repeat protein